MKIYQFDETIETAYSRIKCTIVKYVGERNPICSILKFTGDWECETIYQGKDEKEFERIYLEFKEDEIFDIC